MKTKIDQKNKNSIKQTSNRVLHKKAFTLIELLVVVAIISLLTSLVLSSLTSARMKANDTKIAQDLRQFRISAELYYNEYHVYPPLTMNYGDKNFAVQDTQNKQIDNIDNNDNNNWANKLSFFVKTAEAAAYHATVLCANFDRVADTLISKKYLSVRPVHPYDNDAAHICYKAISNASNSTFSVYGSLAATQVSTTAGVINKRTGFIIGDTTQSGISSLAAATVSADAAEVPYPIAVNGSTSLDLAASLDAIPGITSGSQGSADSGGIVSTPTIYYPATHMSCQGSVCTCNDVYVFLQNGSQNTISGTCSPQISCLAVVGVTYDPVTNTCIDTRPGGGGGGGSTM
jgi:prepilin-type N-terminal cleavage/methylation domain-containing protein